MTKFEEYNLTKVRLVIERLEKERDDANKTASDAKWEIDRLVKEVNRLKKELDDARNSRR
jgi:hypothetical protein